jgi:hypothetical protein
MEAAYYVKYKKSITLSPQQLTRLVIKIHFLKNRIFLEFLFIFSCSSAYGNNGCNGGMMYNGDQS